MNYLFYYKVISTYLTVSFVTEMNLKFIISISIYYFKMITSDLEVNLKDDVESSVYGDGGGTNTWDDGIKYRLLN